MLHRFSFNLLMLFMALFVNGCAAHRDMIVLMPDPDGSTGSIIVANQAGSVAIDSPSQATILVDSQIPPAQPLKMENNAIDAIFAEPLSVQPMRPLHFVLYFDKDTRLTAESSKLVPDIIKAIQERNSTDISVVGHTDTVGSKDYNQILSRKRADSVKDLLVAHGVKTNNILTTSHGKENPLIKTEDNVMEPRNRRVEVVVR